MSNAKQTNERQEHESLVPGWVELITTMDSRFGYILPARHSPWGRKLFYYWGPMYLLLVSAGMLFWAIHALVGYPHEPLLSGLWILAPSAAWVALMFPVRFLAFRWIRQTWYRITGEKSLEPYLYVTEVTTERAAETLLKVAERVTRSEIPPEEFHLARDIAALHMLCDRRLRMRDLAKHKRTDRTQNGSTGQGVQKAS